jgi:HK97 family phage portal protein
VQQFANAVFSNGANPSGAIESDDLISGAAPEEIKAQVEAFFSGPRKAGKVMVLGSGLKWKSISVSPEDAEFLASRRFTTEELCRLFDMPPVIVGDLSNSSFNNTETLTRFFAQSTLVPWIRKVEAEFSRSVFSDRSRQLNIDLSALLRGDPEQRWRAWEIAVKNNILSADEIRLEEGYNPRGDAA